MVCRSCLPPTAKWWIVTRPCLSDKFGFALSLQRAARLCRRRGSPALRLDFSLSNPCWWIAIRYLPPLHALFGEVPSFWNTGLWNSYVDEAGLFEVHTNQGDFGHVTEKRTTLGTNYADDVRLEVLNPEKSRKPSYQGKSTWLGGRQTHRSHLDSHQELAHLV